MKWVQTLVDKMTLRPANPAERQMNTKRFLTKNYLTFSFKIQTAFFRIGRPGNCSSDSFAIARPIDCSNGFFQDRKAGL